MSEKQTEKEFDLTEEELTLVTGGQTEEEPDAMVMICQRPTCQKPILYGSGMDVVKCPHCGYMNKVKK